MSFTWASPFSMAWYRCATLQRWGMLKASSAVSRAAAALAVMVLRQVRKGASWPPAASKGR